MKFTKLSNRIFPLVALLGTVALAAPDPAVGKRPAGKRRSAAPVVAKFGGECPTSPFRPSAALERLLKKTKARFESPCEHSFCEGAFAYDLGGDGRREYLVKLSCGVTGNCTWGIFSDHPARFRGVFFAWFFYVHERAGSWNSLTAYARVGGQRGFIMTHAANRRGYYTQTSERDEQGYYGNPQPFLKRMGLPKCS